MYETIIGFNENHVTTTTATKSVQYYPFPAVTFHPGGHNSKLAFLRHFLNKFEFTRYYSKDSDMPLLLDNDKFMNLYKGFLGPMIGYLFHDIENLLMQEDKFLEENKEDCFHGYEEVDFVCPILALHNRNISLEESVKRIYLENLFKYRPGFYVQENHLRNFLGDQIYPVIKGTLSKENLQKSEISNSCNETKNKNLKKRMRAMLYSFCYLFRKGSSSSYGSMDWMKRDDSNDVGAGDIASGPYYQTGLWRVSYDIPYPPHYISAHTLVTNMYNDMMNASLPISILEFPAFFTQPENFRWKRHENESENDEMWKIMYRKFSYHKMNSEDRNIKIINNMIELINITNEAMRNYHYLWYTYINRQNFTLFCRVDNDCNNEKLKFLLAEEDWHLDVVKELRNNPQLGKLIEADSTSPPCANTKTVQKLKIESICNFVKNVSRSKRAFLNLMKYTKQSPVYLEHHNDISSIPLKYGYTLKNRSEVGT